jgi:putative membrane protein
MLPQRDEPSVRPGGSVLTAPLYSMQQRIAAAADAGQLSKHLLESLNQTLAEITNELGGCERIKNTPLTRQYHYYFALFIYLYYLMFPVSIVREAGMLTPLLSCTATLCFLTPNRIGKNLD